MKIITAKEIKNETKTFFELAEKEKDEDCIHNR
jgi:hypothetical protein